MTTWVGAGLAALVFLIAGDLAATAGDGGVPSILIAAALTLALIDAGCLALARVGFEWEATSLDRAVSEDGAEADRTLDGDDAAWPALPELMWVSSLYLLLIASLTFLVAVWWWAI